MTSPMPTERKHRLHPPQDDAALADLELAWRRLLAAEPQTRIRDAAERLGVSEMQLLVLPCGATVVRLQANWTELLRSAATWGPVMALTRNRHAVHERSGPYPSGELGRSRARLRGGGLELQHDLSLWRCGFAVAEAGPKGTRRSLQFFDGYGDAVHKIFATESCQDRAFDELIRRYGATDQSRSQPPLPRPAIDRLPMRTGRKTLPDLAAAPPLRPAGSFCSRPVTGGSTEHVLRLAAHLGLPLRIEVKNRASRQIFSGRVHNICRTGPWLNVLDAGLNLHLRDDRIASSWVAQLPSGIGEAVPYLTTLDDLGAPVVSLYSADPAASRGTWNELINALPTPEATK